MAIQTECPGCKRRLQVGEEYAGQQARCPVCGEIYTVPGQASPAPTPASAPTPAGDEWRMRTPEGQLYGPVSKEDLDRWVAEGRVTADCELQNAATADWRAADEYYAVLREARPAATPVSEPSNRYRYTAPHRGTLVLVLGLLGWIVLCPLFGVAAWVMGSSDLREMRGGQMDPGGRGLTQAGMILGMIQSLIAIGSLVIFLFVALARVAIR